jgi:bifunctional UDP-N-acetylglucosamine pyrophosphorylase/glucosamine-1-phosphate N-acetyltransferase
MKAVILVAGEGKRLRPLTDHIPKAMVRVGGKPIIEYTLGILPPQISEVILVVGYRRKVICQHLGSSFGRLKLTYVKQLEPKGTGDALLRARPFLDDQPFMVLYGDDLYHPEDLAACIGEKPKVLVKASKNPERFGVCLIDDHDKLVEILEKRPNPPTNLVNIGVYLLTKDIFEVPLAQIPNGEYNLAEQIGVMAKKRNVFVERSRFWHPIGYPRDLEPAEKFLALPLELRLN